MRIVSFVAASGTGKTTLIEKLIGEFSARGLKSAVIKHDAHSFEIDKEGKDSWRFTRAGAVVSAIVSDEKTAVIETRKLSLRDMLDRIHDVDIVLVEGFKGEDCPKIEVRRSGLAAAPLNLPCIAVATDVPVVVDMPFGITAHSVPSEAPCAAVVATDTSCTAVAADTPADSTCADAMSEVCSDAPCGTPTVSPAVFLHLNDVAAIADFILSSPIFIFRS